MAEFRRGLTLDTEREWWRVRMGPIAGLPAWHEQSKASAYPFPTVEAATRFAQTHSALDPQRDVAIVYPDGRIWDGKRWIT